MASLELDGGTLRAFTVGGIDVVQSVGIRFRDPTWNTAENLVKSQVVDEQAGRVRVQTVGRSILDDLDCEWRWEARLSADGALEVELRVTALRDFQYARIGHVAMLTPDTYIGAECVGRTPDGELRSFVIPRLVAAQVIVDDVDHPPFPRVRELTVRTTGGHLTVRSPEVALEMEDQRNWTDNSFKLYTAGPASVGALTARKGQVFEESLRFAWKPAGACAQARPTFNSTSQRPVVRLVETEHVVPWIGTTYPTHPFAIPDSRLDYLGELGLRRLRFDVFPGRDPDEAGRAERAVSLASSLGASLAVAVHIPRRADALSFVSRALDMLDLIGVESILPLGDDLITRDEHVDAARHWREYSKVECEVLAGSDAHFMELNALGSVTAADGIAWPMSPQMHEQDETTIMLNSRGQRASVVTVQDRFCPDKIVITPVTLRPRFNSEQAKANGLHPGPIPAETDSRQHTAMTAVWTLASIADLAGSGVDSIDYFELAGPAGILTSAGDGTPLSRLLGAITSGAGKPVLAGVVGARSAMAVVGWMDVDADHFVTANLSQAERTFGVGLRDEVFDVAVPPLGAVHGIWDGKDLTTAEIVGMSTERRP